MRCLSPTLPVKFRIRPEKPVIKCGIFFPCFSLDDNRTHATYDHTKGHEDCRGRSDLVGQTEGSMAKLLKPREEVKKAIDARIRAGKELTAKAEIAENTGGYKDWLFIFAKWREETA